MIEHEKNSHAAEVNAKLAPIVSGTRLTTVRPSEHDWLFSFGPVWNVRTGSYWRLLAGGSIAVSVDDHGHMFGLSQPVDAAERVTAALTCPVSTLEIAPAASDLRIHFDSHTLELLNTSCGYEGWMLTVEAPECRGWLVSLGGGGVAGTI